MFSSLIFIVHSISDWHFRASNVGSRMEKFFILVDYFSVEMRLSENHIYQTPDRIMIVERRWNENWRGRVDVFGAKSLPVR